MARLHLRSSGHSQAGVSNHPNDDAWMVRELSGGLLLAAIADGVGAAREGGSAARRAVEMLADYFAARPTAWSPRRALLTFCSQINRQLYQEAVARYGQPELVTTLTAVAVCGGRGFGLSVGDSPAWLFRQGDLRLLTQPHVSSEPGEEHVLTRAIGLAREALPHVFELDLEPGDQLLLGTDGVSRPLAAPALAGLLARQAAARAIVTTARESAGSEPPDDATAIVLEVTGRDDSISAGQTLRTRRHLEIADTFPDGRLLRPLDAAKRVWLAVGNAGDQVLLKFPPLEAENDESRAEGFLQEAWQASRLDAPEFVRSRIPGDPVLTYYVQEYIEAPSLRQVLSRGPLPVEAVLALGQFLTRATQFLASRDLAHADLKPDNLLVVSAGPIWDFRLVDLGCAAEMFSTTARTGTSSYLAPERFRGAALSERTELFSIGVILYEGLTGRLPFGEIERFQSPRFPGTPPAPSILNPATPPWLDHVVRRALSVSPDHRYAHYSELAHDLQHPQEVRPFQRPGAPLLERNPVRFYQAVSLLLLGLNALLLFWRCGGTR